jgi:hypothetical protein
MPVDYYPNKSIEELRVILGKLQGRQVNGAIIGATAAGVSTTRAHGSGAGNSRTEVEMLRVLYSLHLRAAGGEEAANYPNPYRGRITRTRAAYVAPDQLV